jgi:hypothetical protein
MRFFAEGVVGAGWTLKATTVSSTIILVIEKDGRVGAIEIADSRPVISSGGLLGTLGSNAGDVGETEVRISVNHKDAVQDQAPFEGGTLLSQVLFNPPAPEPATTLSTAALPPQ